MALAFVAGLQRLPERYVAAQERGDIEGTVALLSDDAWLTMPPQPAAYLDGKANVLEVLTLAGGSIAATTVFTDTSVFAHFGLPAKLRD